MRVDPRTAAIKRKKSKWIGHILRRKRLLKHITEGKIDGTRRRERRYNQIIDDLKDITRCRNLKSETTYGTVWRTRYRGSCRPVLDRLREDDDDDDDNNNNDIYVYIFNSYY